MKGKRGPLIAVVGVIAVSLLVVLFLVMPKMGDVSTARTELDEAQSEQQTLESQLQALRDAQDGAGVARETIAEVDRQIPPVADQPGYILLLQNAALGSGLEFLTVSPGTPTFNAETGVSVIPLGLTGTGSYFDVAEFLFRIETLPRAAKTLDVSLAPESSDETEATTVTTLQLTMTANIELYTSDTSAGPGSIPGPTTETPDEI